MSKSRQNKKIWKKAFIVYDVNSLPTEHEVYLENVSYLARDYGILLYDSDLGDKPVVIPKRYSVKFREEKGFKNDRL